MRELLPTCELMQLSTGKTPRHKVVQIVPKQRSLHLLGAQVRQVEDGLALDVAGHIVASGDPAILLAQLVILSAREGRYDVEHDLIHVQSFGLTQCVAHGLRGL